VIFQQELDLRQPAKGKDGFTGHRQASKLSGEENT
jgi:hypothetical protein